jgi:SAM-dependent methyltransferase
LIAMSALDRYLPLARFAGLAEKYAQYRPSYPDAALDWVETRCGPAAPERLLVDVGCGTGISARLFAARGWPVVGIEPNADMRAVAQRAADLPGGSPRYLAGQAEDTALPDGCADVVVAAQAFHWFDAPRALAEFHRLLKPGGWAVLLWNQQDVADPFTAAYRTTLRNFSPEPELVDRRDADAGQALLVSPLFEAAAERAFPHGQDMTEDGLLGRAATVSYAPRGPEAAAALALSLRRLFHEWQKGGRVRLCYRTVAVAGRRHGDLLEGVGPN